MTAARPHRPSRLLRPLLAAALLLTAALLPATPAEARGRPNPCSASAVSGTRQNISSAISARGAALQRLATTLDAWTHVTAEHRGLLNQLITGNATALSQFNHVVGGATACRTVQLDGQQVVNDFRVYSLVLPQTYLTVAADTGAYGASQLAAAEPDLRLLLQKAQPADRDKAQTLWVDLLRQAAAAQTALSPVGDAVLALSPSSYFPDTRTVLARESEAVTTGTSALSKAIHDAEQLQALIR